MSSQARLAYVCGCSAVPLAWGGLGSHIYRAFLCFTQSRHKKTQHTSSFSSSSSFPCCCCSSPGLLGFFLIAVVGTVYFCCGSHSVHSIARITAGFPVTYCRPHCVWQMHKAGRQTLDTKSGGTYCTCFFHIILDSVEFIKLPLSEGFFHSIFRMWSNLSP